MTGASGLSLAGRRSRAEAIERIAQFIRQRGLDALRSVETDMLIEDEDVDVIAEAMAAARAEVDAFDARPQIAAAIDRFFDPPPRDDDAETS